MIKTRAFWFNNRQTGADILQPEFFTPKTQLEIRAQLPDISFPVQVNVDVFCSDDKRRVPKPPDQFAKNALMRCDFSLTKEVLEHV